MLSEEILVQVGVSQPLAAKYFTCLQETFDKYSIDTSLRISHFLAQILHESGMLKWNKELASGAEYEGRKDLGNTVAGDGIKFKGRGFIQVTGRANYSTVAKVFNIDCVNQPELLEQTPYCALTAGWYWDSRKLNDLADKDDVTSITKRVNGGLNGIADRTAILNKIKPLLIQHTAPPISDEIAGA